MESKARQFLEEMGLKASEDDEFKKALMQDPGKAVEKKLKVKLPKNIRITVLEEKPDELFIVIPHKGGAELSEAELESVAGGKGICWKNPSCAPSNCAISSP